MATPGLEAFRRLLTDAAAGGQAKVDALLALTQRNVFVPLWSRSLDSYRTLTNSDGVSALPIFTAEDSMKDAAERFGWLGPDGSVAARELSARDALKHAVAHGLAYVVVDIASSHPLEVEHVEIVPLLSPLSTSEASGPFLGVGRISSKIMEAVKPVETGSARPRRISVSFDSASAAREAISGEPIDPRASRSAFDGPSGVVTAPPPSASTSSPGRASSTAAPLTSPARQSATAPFTATPPSGTSSAGPLSASTPAPRVGTSSARGSGAPAQDVSLPRPRVESGRGSEPASPPAFDDTVIVLSPLRSEPSDVLLDALSEVLRGYPEVEWAALVSAARGPSPAVPTLGLRVDTGYRTRVPQLLDGVREACAKNGAILDTLLLDAPALLRTARTTALVFYPWRRR